MLELQNTLTEWFRQFTPNVYVFGDEYDVNPDGTQKIKPMPLISFGYPTTDFAVNGLMTFNIWTESESWRDVSIIEDKILRALPSHSGVTFEIEDINITRVLEYFHPGRQEWIEFTLAEIADIAQDIWNRYRIDVEWREIDKETKGESRGGIWLQRGNPFTQSVPDVDRNIKRRTGNIIIRSFLVY